MRVMPFLAMLVLTSACMVGSQLHDPDDDPPPALPSAALLSFRLLDTLDPRRVVGAPGIQATLSPDDQGTWRAMTIGIANGSFEQRLQVDGNGKLYAFPPGYASFAESLGPYLALDLQSCSGTDASRGRCLKPITVRRVAAELRLGAVRDSFAVVDGNAWRETITVSGEVIARESAILVLDVSMRSCGGESNGWWRLAAPDLTALGGGRYGVTLVLTGIAGATDATAPCTPQRLGFRLTDAGGHEVAIECTGQSPSLQPAAVRCGHEVVTRAPPPR